MTRHWQEGGSGFVYSEGVHGSVPYDATEVRVVPLDAIVIERSGMPRITKARGGDFYLDNGDLLTTDSDETPEAAHQWALNWLALAEHLAAHPPVDEAQVDALYAAAVDAGLDMDIVEARRLIATGKVTVTTDGGAS